MNDVGNYKTINEDTGIGASKDVFNACLFC